MHSLFIQKYDFDMNFLYCFRSLKSLISNFIEFLNRLFLGIGIDFVCVMNLGERIVHVPRWLILFVLVWAFAGLNRSFGGPVSVHLNLLGAGPTGTVFVTSQFLPSGYQTYTDVYAGVLDWTDQTSSSTPDYWTYCVDIASVIGISPTHENPAEYSFSSESFVLLSSQVPFSSFVMDGIENLWNKNLSGFKDTLSGKSTNYTEATELQIALWDIIYNGSTGTLLDGSVSTSPLYFQNANPGVLGAALALATTAYDCPAPAGAPGLMALEATGDTLNSESDGQNQIYLGTSPPPVSGNFSVAPSPNAFNSFLALLGILGLFRVSRLDLRRFWRGRME